MSLLPMLYARASAPKATVGDADAFVDAARTSGCAPSANETIDDVATMDLRCVLAQRLVGLAHARRVADDDGALAMRRACDAMERFLEDVTALECAPKSEREAIEAALGRDDDDHDVDEDEKSGRAEEASTSSNVKTATRFMSLGGMTRDARGDKLRRFKRRKEIRARVDAVRAAMARLDDDEDASDDETNRGNDEDELAREYWILEIESAILDTLDELPTMRMEREMLERRDEIEETREIEERRRAAEDDRVGRAGAQNFTIERATAALTLDAAADHRSRFRDGVFKPSHILPTMTVEEFGEIERKEMLEREIQSARRAALRDAERAAKSTDEIEEEELRQAREWDDFKDDNPYGSGNSRLRPCS